MNSQKTDLTTQKTNKIEFLKRQVKEAATVVARKEAKYNAFVEKATLFAALEQAAEDELGQAENCWKLFLQVKSDLAALEDTNNEVDSVAAESLLDVRQLIASWEAVTEETLVAAETIVLMANYIEKRKASNPLIADDLVNDALAAARKAEATVSIVIKAFEETLSALSPAAQTRHTSLLTNRYTHLVKRELLGMDAAKELLPLISPKNTTAIKLDKPNSSLAALLEKALSTAKLKSIQATKASESANTEMNTAKEELTAAQAVLASWEAALAAAETAVGG